MAKYTDEQKQRALDIAANHSIPEASRQTGIPEGSIKRLRHEQRHVSANNVVPMSNDALVVNEFLSRLALASALGRAYDGKRDYYDILGYKRVLNFADYYNEFDRGDIGYRVVKAFPEDTWRTPPTIYETEDEEITTPFEQAWSDIASRLNVWSYCNRVDILAGIGKYGVLVIGANDSADLSQPLTSVRGPQDIVYLAAYTEKTATVEKIDLDVTSPNYGKPEIYKILMNVQYGNAQATISHRVHYTRVIHVAENLEEDEINGRPRLRNIMNRLHDLVKVGGGSAEMFWKNADPGLKTKLDADVNGLGGEINTDEIKEQIENYIHGLTRYMRLQGVDAEYLTSNVFSPKDHVDVIMSMISAATGIPKRKLTGSERGELASSQDETNWNTLIQSRQHNFAEPTIVRPLIDRLIAIGALPKPTEPYQVKWPNLFALSEKEHAEVADKVASALQKVAPNGDVTMLGVSGQFVEKHIGLKPELIEEEDIPEEVDAE